MAFFNSYVKLPEGTAQVGHVDVGLSSRCQLRQHPRTVESLRGAKLNQVGESLGCQLQIWGFPEMGVPDGL